jgi:hypothetical protein
MAANPNNVISAAPSSVSTSAYTQISASTPVNTTKAVFFNNTSSTISFAFGASGSEVDFVAILPTSQLEVYFGLNQCPQGTRISVRAVDTALSGNTKYLGVSILP